MKKVIVIGCKGMAGHIAKDYLKSLGIYDVWGMGRNIKSEKKLINLDVSNTEKLEFVFRNGKFDIVINCIGLLNKFAEDNPKLAIWHNAYFPHLLASFGVKYNFKLIHISTDCVFSGKKGGYKENSLKDGVGFYAQSKALGELINNKDLTIRTSIIGPEIKKNGIGLFHWFMSESEEIYGYTNAIWSGVTTLVLSKAINWAIKNDVTGLYHLTNNKRINKCDLLILMKKYTKKNISIIPIDGKRSNKSFLDTRNELNYILPSYDEMVKDMILYTKKNKIIYDHYQF